MALKLLTKPKSTEASTKSRSNYRPASKPAGKSVAKIRPFSKSSLLNQIHSVKASAKIAEAFSLPKDLTHSMRQHAKSVLKNLVLTSEDKSLKFDDLAQVEYKGLSALDKILAEKGLDDGQADKAKEVYFRTFVDLLKSLPDQVRKDYIEASTTALKDELDASKSLRERVFEQATNKGFSEFALKAAESIDTIFASLNPLQVARYSQKSYEEFKALSAEMSEDKKAEAFKVFLRLMYTRNA